MIPKNAMTSLPRDRETRASAPKLREQNYVGTFTFARAPVDGARLVALMPGLEYNPKRFAAIKVYAPTYTVLLFKSGQGVCAGSKSEGAARVACIEVVQWLLRLGYADAQMTAFRIQNIVCSVSCGFSVDLCALAAAYPLHATYNPGAFPGLNFRFIRHVNASRKKRSELNINAFVSGECVVTGSRDYIASQACWAWFYNDVLKRFPLLEDQAAFPLDTLLLTSAADAAAPAPSVVQSHALSSSVYRRRGAEHEMSANVLSYYNDADAGFRLVALRGDDEYDERDREALALIAYNLPD